MLSPQQFSVLKEKGMLSMADHIDSPTPNHGSSEGMNEELAMKKLETTIAANKTMAFKLRVVKPGSNKSSATANIVIAKVAAMRKRNWQWQKGGVTRITNNRSSHQWVSYCCCFLSSLWILMN